MRNKICLPHDIENCLRVIGNIAKRVSCKAYVVGGFVRDILLGKTSYDIDVIIEGDFLSFLKQANFYLIKHHSQFLTATLNIGKLRVDVSCARREYYPYPCALPQVTPAGLKDDLFRRDFTINAIAVDITDNFGQIIDICEGIEDLKHCCLRVLHERSFIDDATRILRGARYSARFNLHFEKKTYSLAKCAIKEGYILRISRERLLSEFIRLLEDKAPYDSINILKKLGFFKVLGWRVKFGKNTYEKFKLLPSKIASIKTTYKINICEWLVYIMYLFGRNIDDFLQFAHIPKKQKNILQQFKENIHLLKKTLSRKRLKKSTLYWRLIGMSNELLAYLISQDNLKLCGQLELFLRELKDIKPHIQAKHLISLGIAPSKIYTYLLKRCLSYQIDYSAPKDALIQLLHRLITKNC